MIHHIHVSSTFLFAPFTPQNSRRTCDFREPISAISQRSRFSQSFSPHLSAPNAPRVVPLPTTSAFRLTTDTQNRYWIVLMENLPFPTPPSKYAVINHYVKTLEKVIGSERDAQMCLYNASIDSPFGFCCDIDEESALKLATLPEILSVKEDPNFHSDSKDYSPTKKSSSSTRNLEDEVLQKLVMKTKKLFVSGLSFYTSENSLRAAFEEFGEISRVNVISDPISKRSKGYGFVEFSTETAAAKALKEMNGKIINGWVIAVDVAKGKSRK